MPTLNCPAEASRVNPKLNLASVSNLPGISVFELQGGESTLIALVFCNATPILDFLILKIFASRARLLLRNGAKTAQTA
jgi:hypothetical protein